MLRQLEAPHVTWYAFSICQRAGEICYTAVVTQMHVTVSTTMSRQVYPNL